MYVVMRLHRWSDFESRIPQADIVGPEGTIGCLLVYESREQAEADFPDHEVIEIQFATHPATQEGQGDGDY